MSNLSQIPGSGSYSRFLILKKKLCVQYCIVVLFNILNFNFITCNDKKVQCLGCTIVYTVLYRVGKSDCLPVAVIIAAK